ncbi:MAG TPA: hypothetical protein VFX49_13570 [Chloroflexota bacterium]|nr:hypothetical protein [Chloroflexota bacterium]
MRWAIVWGAFFGIFVLSNVRVYVTSYPTLAQRIQAAQALQTFAILLGPLHHAETVAGFTMWRITTVCALIGAVWGLRTSVGLLRGEEDEGRWELLLAGRTTPRAAAAEVLLGLAAAQAAMFATTAVLILAAATLPGARFTLAGSLLFAAGLVACAAMFLAVGAVTSQLCANRGQAVSLAAAALGLAYAVRVVADSTRSLGWLRWFSPIGWIEELRPLRDPQPIALLPIAALIALCAVLTVVLAGRRDLNGSILRERAPRPGDVRWLRGPLTLALRLTRGGAIGWLLGIGAMAYIEGAVARSAAAILSSSPAFAAAMRRLGVRQGVQGYLGAAFFFVAVMLAVMAATQVAAMRDEEASGRLDTLLVRPVHRVKWLAGRLAVALGQLLLVGTTAGIVTWIAAASQHAGIPFPKLLEAGVNTVSPAIFVLGLGTLVFGVAPRVAPAAGYAVVTYSILVSLVGALVKGQDWILDTSLFSHIALAPAARPDWPETAALVSIAAALAAAGALAFRRRDVTYV